MAKTISSAGELKGLYPALFTPLNDDDPKRMNNTIDYKKAELIIEDLIEKGVAGLVPAGTTGQSATLSHHQHIDFIKFTINHVADRVPIIAGAGSNCTRESVDTINTIQKTAGKIAFLCVTGYYNNPPQEGLVQYFETLVKETGANIIMYNVPSRTNSYLEPETVIQLAGNANIIGLKQAVAFGEPGQFRDNTIHILEKTAGLEFSVVSGEDDLLLSMLQMGGTGMISATGNIPEAASLFMEIISQFNQKNGQRASELMREAIPFVKACFIRKNPIPLAALFHSPIFQPLVHVLQTEGGKAAYGDLMSLIEKAAPSLRKYH